jgi:glycosyltransferase involved in cell wall biosynthesis
MMTDLRILACAYACAPPGSPTFYGGEELLGWQLVNQLSRFHLVHVLTSAEHRKSIEGELAKVPTLHMEFAYVDLPFWLHPLRTIQGGIQLYAYLWQLKAYLTARRLHQSHGFDLFHQITYANDWMVSFVGAFLPIPYIRGPGGGAHRTPKDFLREYSVRGRLWEQLRVLGQWLFRHDPFFIMGQRRARALLVCNREALEAIPRKWQQKAQLFPVNGVPGRDLALTASAGTPAKKFLVLSAGKLLRLKGFALGIKAFKGFVERCSEAEFKIIGDGPELLRLEELVDSLGLQTKVRFENWMARDELLKKMASCDVFLFPSLRDGGGAVVVEAMAMGKPVVCLDIGGPGMHITDAWGIKVAPSGPQQAVRDLAGALERLYLDGELRLKLGQAARERAEQAYHWDRLGERLMEIYQDVLCPNSGG